MTHLSLSMMLWFVLGLTAVLLLGIALGIVSVRALRRTQTARRESERLLQLLSDNTADQAMFVLDPTGRVAQWNAGAERLLGYARFEVIGQHCACFYTEEDRVANIPQKTLEIAARQGRHALSGARVRKDGRRFFADTLVYALRGRSGRLTGFSSIERDITELMQLRQALHQTTAALAQAQKMAALGRLSDGIAHDFTNVVHVIANCVEALQRQLAGQSQSIEFLRMIKRNAERAAGLCQHLLALARRPALNPTSMSVNEVVADVVELLRHTLSDEIALECSVGDDLPWTVIDPNQLEAALMNLAANARDAMPSGGKLSIEVSEAVLDGAAAAPDGAASRPGQYIMIKISDTGSGNGAGMDQTPPTGLGLDFVQNFIEQSGGRLKREGQPDSGTTVRLYLPCRAG